MEWQVMLHLSKSDGGLDRDSGETRLCSTDSCRGPFVNLGCAAVLGEEAD